MVEMYLCKKVLLASIRHSAADVARLAALLVGAELTLGAGSVLAAGGGRGRGGRGRGGRTLEALTREAGMGYVVPTEALTREAGMGYTGTVEALTREAGMGYVVPTEALGKNLRCHRLQNR